MTRLSCLPWLVCRSVLYYTNLHDWVIKWFQARWQKCPAFKTCKKCGRPAFPSWLCRSRKSLAASTLTSGGGSATKKVPQAPESRQLRRLHQGVFVWTAWPHRGAFASFPKKLTNAWRLPSRGNKQACNWLSRYSARLQVVPHFSSGIIEQAKREHAWKSPHVRKGDMWRGERKMRVPHFYLAPSRVAFSRVGWFSRALAFRSLYILSLKKNEGLLVVYIQLTNCLQWQVCWPAGMVTWLHGNMVLRSKLSKSHLGTHAFRLKLLQRHKTKAYFWSKWNVVPNFRAAFLVTLQRVWVC